ncbi:MULTISPECIES: hypothetical protein [unclassified Shinella]|uniref:hypothetical protein n=1 Tax=unclassified Shinella TaxID=2643062 RepID=UPI0012E30195|nr:MULTISPECIES: hypothetical protein [unclassified Shinella]
MQDVSPQLRRKKSDKSLLLPIYIEIGQHGQSRRSALQSDTPPFCPALSFRGGRIRRQAPRQIMATHNGSSKRANPTPEKGRRTNPGYRENETDLKRRTRRSDVRKTLQCLEEKEEWRE